MENYRDIDEEYYAGQGSAGASWIIMRAWDRKDQVVGYYTVITGLLDWTEAMPGADKPWVEKWVREHLTTQ